MKYIKKISSIVLALIMVLAMGTSVFAVQSDSTTNSDKGIETKEGKISIAKQMVFINAEDTTVREPNITYTYTISAVTPTSATITDKNDITGTVKKGVMEAATNETATVAFADTKTSAASANGTSTASKYADFQFDASKFPAPGIYRYMVTESTDVTKASVGITPTDNYSADRYLDVYVQRNNGALEVYGYVLYDGDADQSIKSESATDGGDVSMKSAGYVNTATTSGTQANVDVYKTQNLHIAKTTTGALADPEHDFPITLAFTAASGVSATPKVDVVLGGNGTLTGTATDTLGSYITFATSMTGTVRNESTIDLTGIPEGASVSLVETNNTPDSYKVKAKAGTADDSEELLAEAIVAAGAASGSTTKQNLTGTVKIYITNTLNAISPTNVVMRFAPYLFILGGAMLLLVASRRRKSDQE